MAKADPDGQRCTHVQLRGWRQFRLFDHLKCWGLGDVHYRFNLLFNPFNECESVAQLHRKDTCFSSTVLYTCLI